MTASNIHYEPAVARRPSAAAGPGGAAAPERTPGEARAVADGVRDLSRGIPPNAVPSVRAGRRLIYRFLSWNPWQGALLRLVERLHACRLC